jgi:hypothetical protein
MKNGMKKRVKKKLNSARKEKVTGSSGLANIYLDIFFARAF